MAKVNIEYEFNNCKDCPFLNYGNGKDKNGNLIKVAICKKRFFGNITYGLKNGNLYNNEYGNSTLPPSIPPYKCEYFNTPKLKSLSEELDVNEIKLEKALERNDFIDKDIFNRIKILLENALDYIYTESYNYAADEEAKNVFKEEILKKYIGMTNREIEEWESNNESE